MNENQYENNFRLFLQKELIKRCENNARYSMRAFSTFLGINAAVLSTILSKKRKITKRTVIMLGTALSQSPAQIDKFIQNLPAEETKDNKLIEFKELTQDTFLSLSEWYHDAILELTHIKNFKGEVAWIAKTLDLTIAEINAAIERLIRLNLLEINEIGQWIDVSKNNTNIQELNPYYESSALKKYQKTIIEKSITSLQTVSRSKRDHTSTMMAANSKDMDEAKEMIKDFRYRLATFLQRDETEADQVFQLSVAFFPLTKNNKG